MRPLAPPPRAATPWSTAFTIRVAVVQAAALLVGLGAWAGANGQEAVRTQIAWLNLAVFAALVAGGAQASWLLAARRAVSLRRRELVQRLRAPEQTVARPALPVGNGRAGQRYTVEGSTWHHGIDCLLVLGKPLRAVDATDDLQPCDLCGR